jgi:hypothetical protein
MALTVSEETRAYREGRTRMFIDVLEMMAVLAPAYDARGKEVAGVRERIEAVARALEGAGDGG